MEGRIFRPLNETIEDIKDNLYLQLQGKQMPIPVWVGNPGIAKTSHAKQIADEMGMELFYVSCSKPLEYFSGLPLTNVISLDKVEKGDTYCYWSKPEIIHHANELRRKTGKPVLLLFDDMQILTGGAQQAYFFELVLERSLHNHKLDKDVAIMGTMNHSPEDGFENFFPAIVNRFQWFFVNLPFSYWYENIGQQLDKYIAGFLKTNPEFREEGESIDGPFATYRVWTQLSDLLKLKTQKYGEDNIEDIAYNLALTLVSQSAASALRKSIIIQKEFDFESMVKSGKFNCDKNNTVSQYLFANVVRYLSEKSHFTKFEKFIKECASDGGYDSLVVSVMLELRMIINAIKKNEFKIEGVVGNKTKSGKKKSNNKITEYYQELVDNLIDDVNIIKIMKNPLI